MLVILEVAQDARLDSDVEIVGLIRPHRHKAGAHHETVHLATDRAVHVSNLVSVKIIAARDGYVPILSGAYVAVEAEVVHQ